MTDEITIQITLQGSATQTAAERLEGLKPILEQFGRIRVQSVPASPGNTGLPPEISEQIGRLRLRSRSLARLLGALGTISRTHHYFTVGSIRRLTGLADYTIKSGLHTLTALQWVQPAFGQRVPTDAGWSRYAYEITSSGQAAFGIMARQTGESTI